MDIATSIISTLTTSRPQQMGSVDEHIMLYDVISALNVTISTASLQFETASLNYSSLFYTTGTSLNSTLEVMTSLPSLGRLSVHSGAPPSFLSLLRRRINDSVVPAAIGVGILGNLLLVLVFVFTPLRANALCHYLAALGVSDFIYLLSCLAVWITGQGINLQNTMGVCQITMFALMLFGFLDTWYLFAAHAERMVVQFGSCRAQKWCTNFRTKCIIIVIFVFSLVGFSHYMWVYVVIEWKGTNSCLLMQESSKHIAELGKVEVLVASFLPMLLIIIIDVSLFIDFAAKCGKSILKPDKIQTDKECEWKGENVLTERVPRSSSTRLQDSNSPPPEFDISIERSRVTVMVVIAGLIFIGLTLPSSIFRAKQYFTKLSRPSNKDMEIMIFTEEIVKFNSVYKIFLYLILMKSFRRGLVHLCRNAFRQPKIEGTLPETSV